MVKFCDENTQLYWIKYALSVVMPKVKKITNQKDFGYHGLTHTEHVILFGIDYALNQKTNPIPVILACALHDCARTHDAWDDLHGKNCEPIARKFLTDYHFDLTETEKEEIVDAITWHTHGRRAKNNISACLWDADRTRLSWERGYNSVFFSTLRGKEIASLEPDEVLLYYQHQIDLLKKAQCYSYLLEQEQNNSTVKESPLFHHLRYCDHLVYSRFLHHHLSRLKAHHMDF